ncbi:MAG TPA: right-handed parallel beta-helix repeat-containing protein [Blastocatellia bacterium]|nr:right-handed parallel beta-helix repeat-containing protein [Blastocatellia bacterium]
MKTLRYTVNGLMVFAACLMFSTMAQAQATRTWVSGVGDDVNPCSRTAPCKTFAGAISKTAAGGEISVLDPAGFGAVTITKAITIDGSAGGLHAGILASLVNGVIVNAGPNDVVTLRHLSINGAGNGLDGIRYLAGKQVNVENVRIQRFTGDGIEMTTGANSGKLFVTDTTISDCAGQGIRMTSTTGSNTAVINRSIFTGNGSGLDVLSNGIATVENSVFSFNTNFGVVAEGTATINLSNSTISNNLTGVSASVAGTNVRITNNMILNNGNGIVSAGTVSSGGNNKNAGNGTPGAPNGAALTNQ